MKKKSSKIYHRNTKINIVKINNSKRMKQNKKWIKLKSNKRQYNPSDNNSINLPNKKLERKKLQMRIQNSDKKLKKLEAKD